MGRRRFRGNKGLGRSDDDVADALGVCINALRTLAEPARQRVLRGIHTWILHDAVNEDPWPGPGLHDPED